MKEILLFGCKDRQDVSRLQSVFALQNIVIRSIEKERYGYPLGSLVGEGGHQEGKAASGQEMMGGELAVPVMVLAGFSMEELDHILALIRQKLAGNSYLKAVLTEQNRNWNIRMLSAHLQEEHRKMTGRR